VLSPEADTARSATWTIDHRDPAFRQKALFVMESGPREYEFELRSDAPDSGLRWDGDALVMTFANELPDYPDIAVSFRYELIDDGRRLRAAEQVRGVPWAQDNVWIFERR
jgi:hypothetical protein